MLEAHVKLFPGIVTTKKVVPQNFVNPQDSFHCVLGFVPRYTFRTLSAVMIENSRQKDPGTWIEKAASLMREVVIIVVDKWS